MSRQSLNIIKKKRLDVVTSDEMRNAGVISDSENIIISDMQKYIEEQRRKFETDSELNMKSDSSVYVTSISLKNNESVVDNKKVSIFDKIKMWFIKLIMRKQIRKVKTC